MDNIKMWTGLSVEESVRMTEDRDKWRKYVHSVASPRIEDGYRTEQNLFCHLYLSTAPPLSVPFFQLFLSTPLCPILSLFSLFLLYHTAEIQRRGLRER